MHKLDLSPRVRLLLTGIAVALSSVTALSVAMAMSALIADPLLALVFAAAAVLLDAYKYLAWPIGLGLLAARRLPAAALVIGSALILNVVSAWASYDRLLTSMLTGQAQQAAIAEQRMGDLQAVHADALGRLASLDAEARSVGEQARQLRERGIVTKAQDLEDAALPRIAEQRERALARLDDASRELTALRSAPVTQAVLPELLAVLLCAGFAVALEVVPALIICAVRLGRVPAAAEPAPVVVEQPAAEAPETATATPVVAPATVVAMPITGEQQDLFGRPDDVLFERLRDFARTAQPGTPIPVRGVTAALGIGSRRAMRLMRTATDLGVMRKTTAGYVAA